MPAPSIFAVMRHVLSRALRETGQALDRAGIWGMTHAKQGRRMGGDDPYLFNDHLSRHRTIMRLLKRGEPVVPGLTAGGSNNFGLKRLGSGDSTSDEEKPSEEVHNSIAFLAPCATLIGNVQLAPHTSIFYKAILKADVAAYGINTIRSKEQEERWRNLPVGSYGRKQDAGLFDDGSGVGHPTIGGANGGGIYIGEGTNIQDACIVTSYEGHTNIGRYVTVGHAAHIHSASVGDESLIGMGAILKPGSIVESQSFVAAGAVVERGTIVKGGEIWGGNPARKLRDLTNEEKGRLRMQAEKYIDVATSHNHVMELGGNVPDSFIDHDLLGMGSGSDSDLTAETMKQIPSSDLSLSMKQN
ncbi:hypothetical protein ACHAWU_002832 [Discostella pseudostelligera]|uniref:Gamma carbonic anhydrase n=1 Tax=Discostella pseudostelligera TaxID=259834 RepID=A0ABD3M6U5_9STRA